MSDTWQRDATMDGPASGELERRRGHAAGVTRDRLDQMFQHCADLGIEVEWADLPATRHGYYRCSANRIVLNRALTRRQTISALAHEIAHATFGDTCSTPAIERRAWEYAAGFLITPHQYRAAEAMVGHRVASLAAELEVTPKVVEAWRRWYSARGWRVDRSTNEWVWECSEAP